MVDHKRIETAVANFRRLNFPVVNKSVIAELKKREIELAASLSCHCSAAAVDHLNHPSEVVKKRRKRSKPSNAGTGR